MFENKITSDWKVNLDILQLQGYNYYKATRLQLLGFGINLADFTQ